MRTLIAALAVAVTLWPAPAHPQQAPDQGARVRVQLEQGQVRGTVVATDNGGFTLLDDRSRNEVRIRLGDITALEQSAGRQRRFLKYFAIGVGVTAFTTSVMAAATWEPCESEGLFDCFLAPDSRGEAAGFGLVAGAVLGLPIGAIVGLVVREERWESLPLLMPAGDAGFSLQPVLTPGGGVGLALAVPTRRGRPGA